MNEFYMFILTILSIFSMILIILLIKISIELMFHGRDDDYMLNTLMNKKNKKNIKLIYSGENKELEIMNYRSII